MDSDITITPGPSDMSSQESCEGGDGLSSHEDDNPTGGPARKRSRKDNKMSSTDEKIEMMAEKIAKTKKTLESLSPPKLTSRVEKTDMKSGLFMMMYLKSQNHQSKELL